MNELIRNLFFKFGFVINKKQPWFNNHKWLTNFNIETIFDIGANTGQFALEYSQILPKAIIYSFEPVKSVYKELVENTKNIKIKTFNYGIGDKMETVTINVNQFSPSSSILELSSLHKENYKHAIDTFEEEISIKKLDNEFNVADFKRNILVKIDVQGFEDRAIAGSINILSQSKLVFVEITFKELYQNQKLFHHIYNQLYELGFEYHGSLAQNFDKSDGAIIYADALFINKNI